MERIRSRLRLLKKALRDSLVDNQKLSMIRMSVSSLFAVLRYTREKEKSASRVCAYPYEDDQEMFALEFIAKFYENPLYGSIMEEKERDIAKRIRLDIEETRGIQRALADVALR